MVALDPESVETALAASWPALETVRDGGWEARFARGFTGRANAIQVLDPADDAARPERLDALCALYRARGLLPCVKLTPLSGPELRAAVAGPEWRLRDDSLVLVAPAAALDPCGTMAGIGAVQPTDPAWLDVQARLQGYPVETRTIFGDMAALLPPQAVGLTLVDEKGTPLASGLLVIANGIMVPLNIIVAKTARGQGHGRRLTRSLLAWGVRRGARAGAIQVLAANAPAVSLYQSLGFRFLYGYQYRVKGGAV